MVRLYLTRLVLPILFVAAMLALPFVWLPEIGPPGEPAREAEGPASPAGAPARPARPPFQRTMTLGFGLILVSVTAGGLLLFQITRRQSASWRRRFAPPGKRAPGSGNPGGPPVRGDPGSGNPGGPPVRGDPGPPPEAPSGKSS